MPRGVIKKLIIAAISLLPWQLSAKPFGDGIYRKLPPQLMGFNRPKALNSTSKKKEYFFGRNVAGFATLE